MRIAKCPLCYGKPTTDIESGVECCINVCNENAETISDHIKAWNHVVKRYKSLKCPKCGNRYIDVNRTTIDNKLTCTCGYVATVEDYGYDFTWDDLFDKFEGKEQ